MTIIPESQTFDQHTLTLMQEHEPVVQRYRQFFALFDWSAVQEPPLDPSRPGKRPHPETAYLKALLIKLVEGYDPATPFPTFCFSTPCLCSKSAFDQCSIALCPMALTWRKPLPRLAGCARNNVASRSRCCKLCWQPPSRICARPSRGWAKRWPSM